MRSRSTYKAGGKFDKLIADIVNLRGGDKKNSDLVQQMMVTGLKLIDEQAERGDLKIINTALKELRYAFKIFAPYRHIRKVSVFGSARATRNSPEYKISKAFTKEIAKQGIMVITGGANGVMEAANAGAGRKLSFGLNISLPFEQESNPYINKDEKLMTFKYFFTRKLVFIKESDAIVCCPGGFGTLDEAFEALTLIQTGKSAFVPIVMLEAPGKPYWHSWLHFIKTHLLQSKYISEDDLNFLKVTNKVDVAVDEIVKFYSNYHSARFVGDLLVIRAQRVSPALIKKLNQDYKNVLARGGKFESIKALPLEHDELETLHFPRIAIPFNKRSYGRMRGLIDLINQY